MADDGTGSTEAEVGGHVRVALVDPGVLERVAGVVQQVLELVGQNGVAPAQVSHIDVQRLSLAG